MGARIFFAVRAPGDGGLHLARLCVYYKGLLVQSHQLLVGVERGRSKSSVDYTLSRSLAGPVLTALGAHELSIHVNDNGAGSHGFRFFGTAGSYVRSFSVDAPTASSLVESARQALRTVSWGTPARWSNEAYRWEGPGHPQLRAALALLAAAGYRVFDTLFPSIAGRQGDEHALLERLRKPGTIQLALKESLRLVLPLALVYDAPFDSERSDEDLQANTILCPKFEEDAAIGPLTAAACFNGSCPSYGRMDVVCPSGFWGFRHAIGLPPSLGESEMADAAGVVELAGRASVMVAVSMDPKLQRRDAHVAAVEATYAGTNVCKTRAEVLAAFQRADFDIAYFYCHGGTRGDGSAYLQVGASNEQIGRPTLRGGGYSWGARRPLVFMNGCHTADLEPERAIELVTGFVETAGAAGVIGTEITIFEPLATAFAEGFFNALLRDKLSVGEAIRRTRLAILRTQGNPLGLVYVPYALSTLSYREPETAR